MQREAPARERIVDAALALFLRDGYSAVTVADIAAAASTSRATFYEQFDGKSAILAELTERIVDEGMNAFAEFAALPDTSEASLRGWIERLVRLWQADAELIRLVFANRTAEIVDVERARLVRAVDVVTRNPAHWSALSAEEARTRAFVLVVAQRQVLAEWVLFAWPVDTGELVRALTEMWLASLHDGSR